MVDEPDDMLKPMLRKIYGSLTRIDERLNDLTARIGGVENSVAQLRVEHGHLHVAIAEQSSRMDRVDSRLTRIEARLELVEA